MPYRISLLPPYFRNSLQRAALTNCIDSGHQWLHTQEGFILYRSQLSTHQFRIGSKNVSTFLCEINTTHSGHIIDIIVISSKQYIILTSYFYRLNIYTTFLQKISRNSIAVFRNVENLKIKKKRLCDCSG